MKRSHIFIALLMLKQGVAFGQTILGLDVSALQGTINWTQVAASGKTFAFVKATKGSCYTDSKFVTNMVNGKAAGLAMGAYDFALPEDNTATAEANYFLATASTYIGNGYLPPVLDLEDPSGTCIVNSQALTNYFTSSTLSTWVQTWATTVQNATGVAPIVYTSANIAAYLNSNATAYKLWIADPGTSATTAPTNIGSWSTWAFKQYDWYATVSGITGNVDLDVYNGNTASFNALIGQGCTPTATNNLCGGAIVLTPSATCTYVSGTTCGATPISPTTGMPTCVLSPTTAVDVWYKFVATQTNATVNVQSGANFDAVVHVLSNVTCGSAYTQLACTNNTGSGGLETVTLTGLTIGSTYWVRIFGDTTHTGTDFQICVTSVAPPQNDTVTTSVNPVGAGTTTGAGIYTNNQLVNLNATANPSYYFVNWAENGNLVTTNAAYSFNVTANRNLVANFAVCNYTLSSYSVTFSDTASIQSLGVTSSSGCVWTATTGCSWITLIDSTGVGNGTVTFSVSANLGAYPRSCQIYVGNHGLVINQNAAPAPCSTTPSSPSALTVTTSSTHSNQILLNWTGSTTYVSNFEVERALSDTGTYLVIASVGTRFSYVDSNVTGGVKYFYRVKACCNSNCSGYTWVDSATACTFSVAPTGIITSRSSFCAGDSVVLTLQGGLLGTGATWTWRADTCNAGPIISTGASSITVTPTVSKYYTVNAEGASCSAASSCASAYIDVYNLPIADTIRANAATTFCYGDSVTLSGNTTGTWDNGATTPHITIKTSGNYFTTKTNSCGSVQSNHIVLTVNQLPIVNAGNSITINLGDSITLGGSPTASGTGAFTYNWLPNTHLSAGNIANPVAKPTSSITYYVSVTDSNGCKGADSVQITVDTVHPCSHPVANFSASQTAGNCPFTVDYFNQSTTNGAANYLWTFYNGGATPVISTLSNPTGIPYNVAGSFLVKLLVSDSCGKDSLIKASYINVSGPCHVGINEVGEDLGFSIYPNPTDGLLNLINTHPDNGTYQIIITNVLGQSLLQTEYVLDGNLLVKQLEINQLSSGVYILSINSGKGKQTFRVVKE